MPVKSYKPTTPTRRFATTLDKSELTKQTPEKSLTEAITKSGGRNNKEIGRASWRVTV